MPLGPIAGGLLLDNFWWGSVFIINVPMVAIALIAVLAWMPESKSAVRPRFDLAGIVTSTLGLAAMTYGVTRAGEHGWGDATTLATLIGGALVLAVFVVLQRKPNTLVDLGLFSSRAFTWGVTLATIVGFAMFGLLFSLPQYYQAILGTDSLGVGLRLLPLILGMTIGAKIAAPMVAKSGPRSPSVLGFVILAAGLFMGAFTKVDTGYLYVAIWFTVFGIGAGIAMPATTGAALGALDEERSGAGSALLQATRGIGGTLGIALLGTIITAVYANGVAEDAPEAAKRSVQGGLALAKQLGAKDLATSVSDSFVHSMDVMLVTCGGIGLLGALLALMLPGVAAASKKTEAPAGVPAA